jgi:hypothetical protein
MLPRPANQFWISDPDRVLKLAIDDWNGPAGVLDGDVFCPVNRGELEQTYAGRTSRSQSRGLDLRTPPADTSAGMLSGRVELLAGSRQ